MINAFLKLSIQLNLKYWSGCPDNWDWSDICRHPAQAPGRGSLNNTLTWKVLCCILLGLYISDISGISDISDQILEEILRNPIFTTQYDDLGWENTHDIHKPVLLSGGQEILRHLKTFFFVIIDAFERLLCLLLLLSLSGSIYVMKCHYRQNQHGATLVFTQPNVTTVALYHHNVINATLNNNDGS